MTKGSSDNVARKAVEADDGSSHQTDVLTRISAWKGLVPGTHTQQGRNRRGHPKNTERKGRKKGEREEKWAGEGKREEGRKGEGGGIEGKGGRDTRTASPIAPDATYSSLS